MKYECSCQQYADFLNNLTLTQAATNSHAADISASSYPNVTALFPEEAEELIATLELEITAFAD